MPRTPSAPVGPGRSLLVVVFGIVFLFVGIVVHDQTSVPPGAIATARGTVTDLHFVPNASSHGTDQACDVVARYRVGTASYRVASHVAIAPCPYAIGSEINVRYDPTAPGDAAIPSGRIGGLAWLVFVGSGILLITLGIMSYLRARRARRIV